MRADDGGMIPVVFRGVLAGKGSRKRPKSSCAGRTYSARGELKFRRRNFLCLGRTYSARGELKFRRRNFLCVGRTYSARGELKFRRRRESSSHGEKVPTARSGLPGYLHGGPGCVSLQVRGT